MTVISRDNDTMLDKYLTFSSSGDEYGLKIGNVKDIIPLPSQAITPVPGTMGYTKGIINLRGTIIPTIDIRLRFNREEGNYNERTCIIVVEVDDMLVGMIVDEVREVRTIPEEILARPPHLGSAGENHYVSEIATVDDEGKKVVFLLDIKKLFCEGISMLEHAD